MQWIELSLSATHEALDWVRTLLATVDYTGQIEVAQAAQFNRVDPTSQQPEAWAFTVHLALPHNSEGMAQAETIHRLLSPLQRTGLTTALEIEVLEQQPVYAANSGIHRIGQRFVVLPSNLPYEVTSDQILLKIDTSLAFGSGLHPATALSLQLLERHVTAKMNTLDLGCGSGILSVAMARLGAQVLALDNDPIAVQATQDAVALNAVEAQITVKQGSLASGSTLGHWMGGTKLDPVTAFSSIGDFDLIAANILARIHMTLAADYWQALRQTEASPGRLITAGFTTDLAQEVDAALVEVGFTAIDREQQGEWVALAYQNTKN